MVRKLLLMLMVSGWCVGQLYGQIDTFRAIKVKATKRVPIAVDSFYERIYISPSTISEGKIKYQRGLYIKSRNSLFLFIATKGIIDSLTEISERNVRYGDWEKYVYVQRQDTLLSHSVKSRPIPRMLTNGLRSEYIIESNYLIEAKADVAYLSIIQTERDKLIPPASISDTLTLRSRKLILTKK